MTSKENMGARFSIKTRVIVFLALFALVLAGGAWSVLRDERPPNDAHLRSYRRSVKEEENGFRLVDLKKQDVWGDGEEPVLEWHAAKLDRARAAELVEKNAPLLERINRCLALPDFQVDVAGFDDLHPYLKPWRDLGDVLAIRERLSLESGRFLDAVEDGLQIVRFGRRIQSSQGKLVVNLVGMHIESIGLSSLVYGAIRGKMPPEAHRRAVEILSEDVSARWFQDSLEAEYVAVSQAIDDMAEGKDSELLHIWQWRRLLMRFFKPNQAKRFLCEDMSDLIGAVAVPYCNREPLYPAEKYEAGWLSRFQSSKVLASFLLSMYEPTLTRWDLNRFQTAAARALHGLLLANAETGSLPGSLDELVPRWLPSVPLDPFDGKSLRYSPSKQVIYSVGADGRDAGGSGLEDPLVAFRDQEEPTLRFSIEAWDLEAMEKKEEDSTKRAKKRPKPRTRP